MDAGRIVLLVFAVFGIAFPIWVIMRIISMFSGKSETYHINESVENKTKAKSETIKRPRRSSEMDFDDWGD